MSKSRSKAARRAGANVGNPPPGATDQGQNARRRAAQAGAPAVGGSDRPRLSPEQQHMEKDREAFGAAERGSGDKPPVVHGRTRHVENAGTSIPRSTKPDVDAGEPVDPDTIPKTIKVRALKLGYYDDKRRRVGDVFLIRAPYKTVAVDQETGKAVEDEKTGKAKVITVDEFSRRWMEKVPKSTPERTTTGKEELRRKHDEILGSRSQPGVQPTDDVEDVLHD